MALNPRQQKFVDRYLATGNATRAYTDAYGKKDPEVAKAAASRLLASVNVKAEVAKATGKAIQTAELTAAYVIAGLKSEAEYRGPGSQHASRVKAYELLGRAVGLWGDESKPPPGNVNVTILPDDELRRRVEAVRGRIVASGESRQLPVVVDAQPSEVSVGLEASQ